MSLNAEIAFFEKHLSEWLDEHQGEFALIKDNDFWFFQDDEEAYEFAVDKYGNTDVLIKQVLPDEPIDGSLALLYGLLDGSRR